MEPTGETHERSFLSLDAERTTRFEKNLLELQMEASPDGLIVVAPTRDILLSNRRFVEMWQIPEDVVRRGDDRAALAAARTRVRDPNGFIARVEWLYAHPETEAHDELELVDGRVLERHTAPVRDRESGAYYGRLWSFRDISLRNAVSARDEFLSIASHELRSPIAGLQFAIDALCRAVSSGRVPDFPPALAELLGSAETNILRISTLVDTLLDVTKLRSGKLHLELEEVDLRQVAAEIVARHRLGTGVAACDVTLIADRPVFGHWDRSRVGQIVDNLVSNAVKYGAGKPVTVTVSLDGSVAKLAVADHGIGIPPHRLARIFDRFERAVSAHAYEGLGLGLYIVSQIVARLGGRVQVESRQGLGSTFTVELPTTGPGDAQVRETAR